MSKIQDTLNKLAGQKHGMDNSTFNELSKTFFPSKNAKRQTPADLKKTDHLKPVSKLPWIISVLCLLLVLFLLLSKSSININIEVKPDENVAENMTASVPRESGEDTMLLVSGGVPDSYLIKSVSFLGDAEKYSRAKDDMIILVNSQGSGWANYSIIFKEPIDISKLDITYSAHGQFGKEYLVLVLVDQYNRSYRMTKDLTSKLTGKWKNYRLNTRPLKNAIDLSNIASIRFEFGTLTAGNSAMATIYLKDIKATKTRAKEWL